MGLIVVFIAVFASADLRAEHWGFTAPRRVAPPSFAEEQDGGGPAAASPRRWVRNPVDNFVLQRLRKEGLEPSPEADPRTLLRRLYLDLTGLPPGWEEMEAFLADRSPDAFERAARRLLDSPHYGEKWGRQWLDAARYADSNGYEKDRAREIWHYRDWVVAAFNRDLPYDQFIIEQVAGDLLPGSTQDQLIATGFLRNSMINEEGAIDPEQFRMDAMFDRMDCLGKAVLGLTIQCAQCHNHKTDPLKQEEYYNLFAFINSDAEHTAAVYTPAEQRQREKIFQRIADLEEELRARHPDWPERMRAWEESAGRGSRRAKVPVQSQPDGNGSAGASPHRDDGGAEKGGWALVTSYEQGAPDGIAKLQPQKNGSLLAGGHPFTGGTWFVKARTEEPVLNAVRLELLANPNLPMNGPGRAARGIFGLREFKLKAAPRSDPTNWTEVKFVSASADYDPPQAPEGVVEKDKEYTGPIRFAIDDNSKTVWTGDSGPGRRNTSRQAVFLASTNFAFPGGTELRFDLACREEIGCFRLSLSADTNAVADPVPREVREILAIPASRRSASQREAVFRYWRGTVPEFAVWNGRIDQVWKEHPEASHTTLALQRNSETRDTAVLRRGDWLKPLKPVAPGVPAFLHPLPPDADDSRLTFARWLADKKSPTTARAFVNRIWQSYFGLPLMETPEDFGVQAPEPSHPELLDWLACEFMEPSMGPAARPWSMKHIHWLIVTSATYRQSSHIPAGLYERDPYNKLLARGPRFRVEGEAVRDIALAASGLLKTNLGGPPVFAPAPAFLFVPPTSYQPFPWKDVTGPERYRRAIYTFRRRSTPYPMLQTFDTPNGDAACVRRVRSNTPLQALTTLNEVLFVECAQELARLVVRDAGSGDDERITYAVRRVLSRDPSRSERETLRSLLARQRRHIQEGWVSAAELATGTNAVPANLPKGATPADLAAYTVVARVLLNLDETITKE